MKHSKRQAVSKEQVLQKRAKARKHLLQAALLFVIMAFVIASIIVIKNINLFQLKHIAVSGHYNDINQSKMKTILKPLVGQSLFSINEKQLQQKFLNLPWVSSVSIHRHWPHQLDIEVYEKKPVARWNNQALISMQDKLFSPAKKNLSNKLPNVIAPKDMLQSVLTQLGQFDQILTQISLNVEQIKLKQRDDVSITLSNGLKILLGSENQTVRLQRFVDIYSKVFENRLNQVQYVDMRYTNGMAVKWRNQMGK